MIFAINLNHRIVSYQNLDFVQFCKKLVIKANIRYLKAIKTSNLIIMRSLIAKFSNQFVPNWRKQTFWDDILLDGNKFTSLQFLTNMHVMPANTLVWLAGIHGEINPVRITQNKKAE